MPLLDQSYLESRDQRFTGLALSGSRTAVLLSGENPCLEELVELVGFFGIPWKSVSKDTMVAASTLERGQYCVLGYAPDVARALYSGVDAPAAFTHWMKKAGSLYVFGFDDNNLCRNLLRFLTGDAEATIRNRNRQFGVISVTADLPEICGPMSGMDVRVDLSGFDFLFDITHQGHAFRKILTTVDGQLFVRTMCQGVPVYLCASSRTVDLRSRVDKHFDVGKHFCSAVPITMYLRWAFQEMCWKSPETNACLIIDDPPLKQQYGFLNFGEMSELMDEQNFATTIAFIPWNWKRTNRHVVDLFRRRPDRFSLAVHGCDHTENEFGTRSAGLLNRRARIASQRMNALAERSCLPYDRVMVFPQGVFSPETGRALKLNGFAAGVNTEVAPWNNDGNETTIGDLWDVAIMNYGTFPIFTRRYLSAGIENFAFDALLGKPCLIAAHHDVFKGHGRELADSVSKLNSLNWNLRWRPLGNALNRSFKFRIWVNGTVNVCMFSEGAVVENLTTNPQEVVFIKQESDPGCIEVLKVNQNSVEFTCENGYLQFCIRFLPKQIASVRVSYVLTQKDVAEGNDPGIAYQAKARMRRYMCEFRDNYISQSQFLHAAVASVKRLRG